MDTAPFASVAVVDLGQIYNAPYATLLHALGGANVIKVESRYNVHPASDGYIALMCVSEGHWRSLTGLMGMPELATDPKFVDRVARVKRIDEVDAMVSERTRRQTKEQLAEVVADPHLRQHSQEVYGDWLGLETESIVEWQKMGAI